MAYHNEDLASFEKIYKPQIERALEIVSEPCKVEQIVVKILDFD